jgi:hypothetical protein
MSSRSVYCIAPSRSQADRIVRDLEKAEFARAEISILHLDSGVARRDATVASTSPVSDTGRPPALIEGLGLRAVPGVGVLAVAGPIAAFFGRATVGGIKGGLKAFGLPEAEATLYEGRIQSGQFLISVRTDNPDMSSGARDIFTAAGGESSCTMMMVITPRLSWRDAYSVPTSRASRRFGASPLARWSRNQAHPAVKSRDPSPTSKSEP